MGWRLKKDRQQYFNRRSQRFAQLGIELEDEIERLLTGLLEEGKINSFQRHAHHSTADSAGKDFTVLMQINGHVVRRSFGVTISRKSWHDAQLKHPKTPQLCFPIGTKPETMVRRIIELFY